MDIAAPKEPTNGRRAIAAIRRRLEKMELEHLRDHAAELADKVERLEADLYQAERCAESWREDCLRMMQDAADREGGAVGLAMNGSLHLIKSESATAEGPVFIYGPQGCGKTRNASALAKHYGKVFVLEFDAAIAQDKYPDDAIVFSNSPLPGAIAFDDALAAAGIQNTVMSASSRNLSE